MSYSYNQGNSYINKKRKDDERSNKNYGYDRYEKYDKYDKYNGGYSSYHQSNHNIISNNSYYHNNNSRGKNSYYQNPKSYHSFINKNDIRRDYKKSYQKYSNNDSEGIRNLSHYEMPSPKKIEDKKLKNKDNDNEGLIKNINQLVSNFFPNQKVPYQHIFQSQQNINIEINVTTPPEIKVKGDNEKIKLNEEKMKSKMNSKEETLKKNILNIPRPSPKLNIQKFNRSSIIIKENPIYSFDAFPDSLFTINQNISSNNQNNISESKDCNIKLDSSYLLAKIPNWKLVTNFVPGSLLTEEKFENIPIDENIKEKKNFIIFVPKYEEIIEKNLNSNRINKNKVLNDIYIIKHNIKGYQKDIIKLRNKIKGNEFKLKCYSIKNKSLINAIKENNKDE